MKNPFIYFLMVLCHAAHCQPVLGKTAPKLNITDWVSPMKMSEKPKVIVLEFWATWCAPCVAAIPHLNELSDKYKDNATFLSVTNERRSKIEGFLKKKEIRSTVVSDTTNTTHRNFSVNSLPRTFVINANGILVWEGNPTWLNDSVLKAAIDEKLPVADAKAKSIETPKNIAGKKNDFILSIDQIKPGTVSEEIFAEKYTDSTTYLKLYNLNLQAIIRKFMGISWPRVISSGKIPDMNLTLIMSSDKITFKNKKAAHDYIISNLSLLYNFSVQNTIKQADTYSITIVDAGKFNKCRNTALEKGSHISSNEKEVISTNVDMKQFVGRFEEDFEILLSGNKELKDYYDITYPLENFEEAKIFLEKEYGIALLKTKSIEEFTELRFK